MLSLTASIEGPRAVGRHFRIGTSNKCGGEKSRNATVHCTVHTASEAGAVVHSWHGGLAILSSF